MSKHNSQVIKLLTDRYSHHVKAFNRDYEVSDADSDRQYDLYRELAALAETVFARAPQFKPSGNRVALVPWADLGNARIALKRSMTDAERARYDAIQDELNELADKYEG